MEPQEFRYDDLLVLHLNGRVFAASYRRLVDELEEKNGLRVFDWNRLRNLAIDPRGYDVYCLGHEAGISRCVLPRSDSRGQLEVNLDQEVLYRLSASRAADEPVRLGLVTTGDNDESDCRHSRLRFAIDFDYVE